MKLGVASFTIVIFTLWIALGTLIFGLLDSAGALSQLFFLFVWLGVLRVAFAIYDPRGEDPRGERSASVMRARATPGKALTAVLTVVVLTLVVIGAQLVLPDRLLYRVVVLALGGVLLMCILNYFETRSTAQQK